MSSKDNPLQLSRRRPLGCCSRTPGSQGSADPLEGHPRAWPVCKVSPVPGTAHPYTSCPHPPVVELDILAEGLGLPHKDADHPTLAGDMCQPGMNKGSTGRDRYSRRWEPQEVGKQALSFPVGRFGPSGCSCVLGSTQSGAPDCLADKYLDCCRLALDLQMCLSCSGPRFPHLHSDGDFFRSCVHPASVFHLLLGG